MLPFEEISKKHPNSWNSIIKARENAQDINDRLIKCFKDEKLFNYDIDLVIFGSIARKECNDNSDTDWTILVDGQASPAHRETVHRVITTLVQNNFKAPSPSGIFGKLTFSHNLINYIGGDSDTYDNLSQRILLILESKPIEANTSSRSAYNRVINNVIDRYLEDDSIFNKQTEVPKIPRFLLNDIVRFWRTMCVDFAWKRREQKGKKWAIRNIKLRMSRKLIFISGLLMVFECYKHSLSLGGHEKKEEVKNQLTEIIRNNIDSTPLDITIKSLSILDNTLIIELLNTYNNFLKILEDSNKRDELEKLSQDDAYSNKIFNEGRTIGNEFQRILNIYFFEQKSTLTDFIKNYGIF